MGRSNIDARQGPNQYGVPQLGLQNAGNLGAGTAGEGVGTLNVGGSRRSGQRFLGGGASSGRSNTDNRSFLGGQNPPTITGTGGTSMAAGLNPGPNEGRPLEFIGSVQQQSDSVTRSYGPSQGLAGGLGSGVSQLNPQNLRGIGGGGGSFQPDVRRSVGGIVQSDVGSLYRGANMEEDALSQFMGQSQIGGGDDQSVIGGQGPIHGQSSQMMSLRPP